ncbi:glycine cleavage system aminomethyltransferase GcvT [Neptunicoccus cionae]|uniref:aminomethyltransferase n=1 Tax=Neptunicoccus cionae TaxID=2035344 RepID=A0A916VMM0_9RHOB|nr:glycine cleavage system aminomethyltransferase GcvT [Amylibacter cionae]GGA09307.1 aminomethyltransferase [Amylibacter cionae]
MSDLKQTPLYDLHVELDAKMVPFAGYEMPVQFPLGVMKEHNHTRNAAGLFDVSHMGQVIITPKSGKLEDAARALESLIPMDVLGLKDGRQRYGMLTNDQGGIRDDLMFANRGDHLYVVVNGACKDDDFAHIQAHLSDSCDLQMHDDRALLALQGPAAETALSRLIPEVADMSFMDVKTLPYKDVELWISRSGYTGEDGYEISIPADQATGLARDLLAMDEVEMIGLGARDSLRLEGGLCLYGNDIDTETTPIEAALNWAIQKARRSGGDREGGFPGADVILSQMAEGTVRKRVGIAPEGRAPMRGGTPLFADSDSAEQIGSITSGGFGPTVGRPVAMGYVTTELAQTDTTLYAELRGKRLPVRVAALPFTPANFKR